MRAFFVAGCVLALSGLVLAQEPEAASQKPSAEQQAADKALLKQKLADLERLQAEIRELRSRLGPAGLDTKQVLVSVRLLEASRKKFKAAGIELGEDGVVGLLTEGTNPDAAATTPQQPKQFTYGIVATAEVTRQLKHWQQQRLVTVLAEPQLVTVSGRPAAFHVGGEFPIVVPQSNGRSSIQYRKFGTLLDAVPMVLDDGRIRLELRPSVRLPVLNRTVAIGDIQVPALWVREVDFSTELAEGQTVVFGGMTSLPEESTLKDGDEQDAAVLQGADAKEFVVLATAEIVDAMQPVAERGQAATPVPTGR